MTADAIASFFGLKLPAENAIQQARIAALQAGLAVESEPAGLLTYSSQGSLLVIGPEPYAISMVEALAQDQLQCHIVATEATRSEGFQARSLQRRDIDGVAVPLLYDKTVAVEGYLGNFRVTAGEGAGARDVASLMSIAGNFDLVLDLRREPGLKMELPPPGYYAPGRDQDALYNALAELPEMVGKFQKVEYIRYDSTICAHGARGVRGCTRCLDACPADAIRSLGECLEVDPYLCHGMGVCATACPTGAMHYQVPNVAFTLDALRRAIGGFRSDACLAPRVLFFDQEQVEYLAVADISDIVLPWQIEEAGAVGMEVWLSCVAYGAEGVVLLDSASVPHSVTAELQHQLDIAQALLSGLGYPRDTLQMLRVEDLKRYDNGTSTSALSAPTATFAGFNDKRAILRLALDHLVSNAGDKVSGNESVLPLPNGSSFGAVDVKEEGCTLCLSCVVVCPSGALSDGVDTPRLDFLEENCVQCGLCKSACPEDVIALRPRFVYTQETRQQKRSLKKDVPFHCVACGKPFGTRSVVEKIQHKLADHQMFQGDAGAMLRMCDDCRVKSMLDNGV